MTTAMQISACQMSLTVTQAAFSTAAAGGKTFELLMASGQRERTADQSLPTASHAVWEHAGAGAEEGLAWLRERFAGKLDASGIADAVASMRAMGLMSDEEYSAICGVEYTAVKVTEQVGWVQVRPTLWDERLTDIPLLEFHSLEEILEWLGRYRAPSALSWTVQCCEYSARRLSVVSCDVADGVQRDAEAV